MKIIHRLITVCVSALALTMIGASSAKPPVDSTENFSGRALIIQVGGVVPRFNKGKVLGGGGLMSGVEISTPTSIEYDSAGRRITQDGSIIGDSRSNFGGTLDCVCTSQYSVGDRVELLIDNPWDSLDLLAGALGTVVCGWVDSTWGAQPIVRWDDLTSGHENADTLCDCETEEDTGVMNQWAVNCDWIALSGDSCPGDLNGDGYVDVSDLLAIIGQWGSCADCDADLNGDGTVDVADLLQLIALWGDCPEAEPLGACVLPSQACTVVEELDCDSLGGLGWLENGSCTDSDGDRIPDDFELGDCSVPSGAFSGSDAAIADTDGDSIADGDEAYGTLAGLELGDFGCNPCRYDLLIETDWVYATGSPVDYSKLHVNQVGRIVAAFANAPVINQDGTSGIKIHIDYGQAPYSNGNSVEDPSGDSVLDMDNWSLDGSEYQAIKDDHFDANRHGYFHYCLMAKQYSVAGVPTGSSGLAELPGDDFVTTLFSITGDDDRIGNTFVHELGHNLNIRHGGFENRNWKPNYNSVMNYRHQFCGVDTDGDSYSDGVLDYSRGTNIALDEDSLDETVGVTGVGPAIDWDEDGDATETNVARNINCELSTWYCGPWDMLTRSCGSGSGCYDSTCDIASDNNDWAIVSYDGITEADLVPREIIHCLWDR